jgi:hypothetical protein
MRQSSLVILLLSAACVRHPAGRVPPLASLPDFAAESSTVDTVAVGLVHRSYWAARGPWAVHLLDVDRAACWSIVALKAGGQAVGRERTSALVRAFADSTATRSRRDGSAGVIAGGVNADFFTFVPPGVPIGPHVSSGRVIAGPWTRPVLAFDSGGEPVIGTFAATGFAVVAGDSLPVVAWNQRRLPGLSLFDRAWGPVTDTATGAVEVVVEGTPPTVASVDTLATSVAIPSGGIVLAAGRDAPPSLRNRLAAAVPGEPVRWVVALRPFHPLVAVGGFPILLRDSVVAADLDSAGGASFGPVRHPRTAVGIAGGGRRVLLVTVDGRQLPYSDGMTLRELAALLLGLGVPTALNLDGGGSTTLVVRDARGNLRIANRPSDREGERPVSNALAVVRHCGAAGAPGRR